ncbi:MAG: putative sporulation protein YtxC [Deltaproteobacteria bacterium]
MRFLSIGVNEYTNESIDYLINELNEIKNKKINIKTTLLKAPESRVIICKLNENKIINTFTESNFNVLKMHASSVLSEYIVKYYEEKLLTRIINMNYCYFSTLEKKQILKHALTQIKPNNEDFEYGIDSENRKEIILKKIIEYLDTSNEIILDGFVNFRMKEYVKELEDVVDKAVDSFLMDKEYQEFIKLLRYFVDIQEPKMEAVHIISLESRYLILDNRYNEITNECIKEFINEIPEEGDINFDDLLVSSLITMAPLRIYIHSSHKIKNRELLETIKNVFVNKVILCSGCQICRMGNIEIEDLFW